MVVRLAPREPSLPTVKRLYAYSGGRCAFQDCDNPLFDPATGACVADICHIKGNRPGAARYDAAQGDDERNGYGNLVVMCAIHARVIDHRPNETRYPVETLLAWKQNHERGVTVLPSSDAIANALLHRSTGVSPTEAAITASLIRHNQLAAALVGSTVAPSASPLPLVEVKDPKINLPDRE